MFLVYIIVLCEIIMIYIRSGINILRKRDLFRAIPMMNFVILITLNTDVI